MYIYHILLTYVTHITHICLSWIEIRTFDRQVHQRNSTYIYIYIYIYIKWTSTSEVHLVNRYIWVCVVVSNAHSQNWKHTRKYISVKLTHSFSSQVRLSRFWIEMCKLVSNICSLFSESLLDRQIHMSKVNTYIWVCFIDRVRRHVHWVDKYIYIYIYIFRQIYLSLFLIEVSNICSVVWIETRTLSRHVHWSCFWIEVRMCIICSFSWIKVRADKRKYEYVV